jgi:hypothetical protein
MTDFAITKRIHYGTSPKNTQPIELAIREFGKESGETTCRVVIDGPIKVDKATGGETEFDAITTAFAGMRQLLRLIQRNSPGVKFYEEFGDKLIERTVDDLFHTADCVPE